MMAAGRLPAVFPQLRPLPEQVVVVLGEAVGLVADVLQQPQSVAVAAQVQRLGRRRA